MSIEQTNYQKAVRNLKDPGRVVRKTSEWWREIDVLPFSVWKNKVLKELRVIRQQNKEGKK